MVSLMFHSRIWPSLATLRDIRPQNLTALEFDLSRSLKVRSNVYGAAGLPKYHSLLLCNITHMSVFHHSYRDLTPTSLPLCPNKYIGKKRNIQKDHWTIENPRKPTTTPCYIQISSSSNPAYVYLSPSKGYRHWKFFSSLLPGQISIPYTHPSHGASFSNLNISFPGQKQGSRQNEADWFNTY